MSSAASSSRVPRFRQQPPTKTSPKKGGKRNKKRPVKSPQPVAKLFEGISWNPVDISGWVAPPKVSTPNVKGWEVQDRVDRLHLLVPYWREGVEVALSGGEPKKMEEFYQGHPDDDDSMDGGWGGNLGENVWASLPNLEGWGPSARPTQKTGRITPGDTIAKAVGTGGAWGASSPLRNVAEAPASNRTPGSSGERGDQDRMNSIHSQPIDEDNSWKFVEKVAQREEASPERKQSMYQFYTMPTENKVKKIQEVVEFLRVHS